MAARSKSFTFMLSAEEFEHMTALARAADCTSAELLRQMIQKRKVPEPKAEGGAVKARPKPTCFCGW